MQVKVRIKLTQPSKSWNWGELGNIPVLSYLKDIPNFNFAQYKFCNWYGSKVGNGFLEVVINTFFWESGLKVLT